MFSLTEIGVDSAFCLTRCVELAVALLARPPRS